MAVLLDGLSSMTSPAALAVTTGHWRPEANGGKVTNCVTMADWPAAKPFVKRNSPINCKLSMAPSEERKMRSVQVFVAGPDPILYSVQDTATFWPGLALAGIVILLTVKSGYGASIELAVIALVLLFCALPPALYSKILLWALTVT